MINYNPLLCLDFYKTCHAEQYPKGLTRMVSYYTPRMSRLADTDKVTMFGLQAFIKEYLIDGFNKYFSSEISKRKSSRSTSVCLAQQSELPAWAKSGC